MVFTSVDMTRGNYLLILKKRVLNQIAPYGSVKTFATTLSTECDYEVSWLVGFVLDPPL